ncbi:DUF1569 domain-containing protein [Salinimicrobium terrae]|uniref:DUF1569 domain-containing protein n=1 Tax=Salinimicrobium terrae TaxID=470866 RepID=UPI00041BB029|nr:DUF1569 domain-containing protein [Salinimicrobium terrae]
MKLQVLQAQLGEMESYIKHKTLQKPEVSKAPVGWHLAHNLKVINSIITGLEQSEPASYRKSFSWKKELVYLFGKIPRGKARAPKKVIPEENISEAELQEQISAAKLRINGITKLPENAFFEHPYFGHIKRDKTPKFLVIHTEHHLKIIREILEDKTK